MRNTLVAFALAALFIAAIFALPRLYPNAVRQSQPDASAKIEPGFKGVQRVGPWGLICAPPKPKAVPLPFTFGPRKPAAPAAGGVNLGRCRVAIVFRRKDDPKRAALVVAFRLAGPQQKLVMVVRMPPFARKGDLVTLKIAQGLLNLPVSGCDAETCVALGGLGPKVEAGMLAQRSGELLLPKGPEGKRIAVTVPLGSLRPAIGAMRRAQAGE